MSKFRGMETEQARHFQSGGKDANGMVPETAISNGNRNPCRHCLQMIEKVEEMLVFPHRPFDSVQPYAEIGPVFLHAHECEPYNGDSVLPPVLEDNPEYLVRGYDAEQRIVYGSGKVVANTNIRDRADELFANPDIEFIHVRSASNNCWQAKINRG